MKPASQPLNVTALLAAVLFIFGLLLFCLHYHPAP